MNLTDKSQVEDALIRAQLAVLNPSRNWREFVPDYPLPYPSPNSFGGGFKVPPSPGDFQVKFSPNVVCMDITGPDLPNLAFIDLPGVIQSTEKVCD